ncbi:hypothetical protein DPMN_139823 [Dreissena polymorpha]|uniref:Uncharacterized protein n=1 Tax=Dreissena polymorpha TaxID=45954 RepID=A0A9D4JJT3_DREPO|nr:hypothetical protein DPMN_139823 [Dreissena polymorpha]
MNNYQCICKIPVTAIVISWLYFVTLLTDTEHFHLSPLFVSDKGLRIQENVVPVQTHSAKTVGNGLGTSPHELPEDEAVRVSVKTLSTIGLRNHVARVAVE